MSIKTFPLGSSAVENLSSIPERQLSVDSNSSSVISWRYSTSMSMSSNSSTGSLKYINIHRNADVGRSKKTDALKKKKESKKKKNFVLMNKQNFELNKGVKLEKIIRNDNVDGAILRLQNSNRENISLPRLQQFVRNQNNNHSIAISSVRSQWPENKITQVEHHFRGELDRLKRTKDDLMKRNRYLEREISKEQEILKKSFPGRTLEHLNMRNAILKEKKLEAQNEDHDARGMADRSELAQERVEAEYNDAQEKQARLQELNKDVQEENEREKRLSTKNTYYLENLNSEISSRKLDLDATEISREEIKKKRQLLEKELKNYANESYETICNELVTRWKELRQKLETLNTEVLATQKDIQFMDAENSNLQTDIQNLQEIRSGLLERCKLAKLQHARQIDLIELSVDDAGKLQMDVEELTILVAKKQTVVDERESIRINSKECGTQTSERLKQTRNIAWIRIAEEETIFSPAFDDSDVITPVVEIFDEENQEFWKKSSKGCESVIGPSQENGGG